MKQNKLIPQLNGEETFDYKTNQKTEFCLNCKKPKCKGYCKEYKEYIKSLKK